MDGVSKPILSWKKKHIYKNWCTLKRPYIQTLQRDLTNTPVPGTFSTCESRALSARDPTSIGRRGLYLAFKYRKLRRRRRSRSVAELPPAAQRAVAGPGT